MRTRTILLIGLMLLLAACERSTPEGAETPAPGAQPNSPVEARPSDAPALPASGTPRAPAPPAGNARLTDGKLVIAVLNDQSGVYANFGGKNAAEAVRMAVEDFEGKYGKNALGGPIEVLSADHQDNPDTAAARAQELFNRGADLLLDVPTSAAALRLMKLAADKRRIFIDVSAATADLTGRDCNRYTFHYAYDTSMLAAGAGWITQNVGRKWHLIYPKYGYGQDMESAFHKAIDASSGAVLASDPSPFPHPSRDFSDLIRRTVAFRPDVFGVLHTGDDLKAIVRQYNALRPRDLRTTLAVGLLMETDIQSLGLDAVTGAMFTTPWHWNMDREARDWADRFQKRAGVRPTFAHAGSYSAAWQYLEAVRRAGNDQPEAVAKALEGYRFNDFFIRNGLIRAEDHFVAHDAYVAQVKTLSEVKELWDTVKIVATIPADRAARPAAESGCVMPK